MHLRSVEHKTVGKLNFSDQVENYEKLADFAIISDDSHPKLVLDLLLKEWKLTKPNLVKQQHSIFKFIHSQIYSFVFTSQCHLWARNNNKFGFLRINWISENVSKLSNMVKLKEYSVIFFSTVIPFFGKREIEPPYIHGKHEQKVLLSTCNQFFR